LTTENLISDTNTASTALDQLVGPGKKFATVEDLAKGKLESDRFVDQLKTEQAGLREDLNQRVRMEELLERLEETRGGGNSSMVTTTTTSETPNSPNIEQLIEQTLTKREKQKTASENVKEATQSLQKHFGEDWETKLKAKAAEHKLSLDDVNDIARRSPSALLEMLGVRESRGTTYTAPTSSTTFSSDKMGGNTTVGGTRNWTFYENLRKTNPSEYWSPSTQLRMHNDAIAAANKGEDFGNR
jgi:hypothetical protein